MPDTRCWWLLLILILSGAAGCAGAIPLRVPAEQRVGQWDRFELPLTNTKRYADPYRDVELRVSYTRPDGRTIDFWGFHDGGDQWKIRFMPDELGRWRYEARFSDGQPGVSGSFEVVPSELPGMVAADEINPIWFGFRGGGHGLLRSLHVGDRFFAENWDDPLNPSDGNARTAFLDWAQSQGYNMLAIGSHYLNRDMEERGRGWDTPDLLPLDAAEYRKMELILDDLARRRIVVFPFAGFFGMASDFPLDPREQERYVRYTLARIGPYWNAILNLSGPHAERNLPEAEIRRLGQLVADLDVFDHPLSVHLKTLEHWPDSVHPYRNEPWSTYVLSQGPKPNESTMEARLAHMSRVIAKNRVPGQPFYLQESVWPGNTCCQPDYVADPEQLRRLAWVALMSATTLNYADLTTTSSSGFSGSLDLADRVQARHDLIRNVWDFFESIPFYRMSPHPELASAGYVLAEPGAQYLVYLPVGGEVEIEVQPGPTYRVTWIGGANTADRRDGGSTRTGRGLKAPTTGDDWLVYLVDGSAPR